MAKDHVELEIVNENDEIETIKIHVTNNVHSMDADRGVNKHFIRYNSNSGESDLKRPTKSLLELTLAGSEIDDLDGDPLKDATPYLVIDDGLLETTDKKPDEHDHDPEGSGHHSELEPSDKHSDPHDDVDVTDDVNGLTTRLGYNNEVIMPDVNTYQQKKNLAQGMMDLALLSANANQFRYVLESTATHPYYYPSLVFISLSIIFQILVGVGLIMNSRYNVNDKKEHCKADKINNMTVLGIFLVTIFNVFITSFSVITPTTVPAALHNLTASH